jgi:hypothetical protein
MTDKPMVTLNLALKYGRNAPKEDVKCPKCQNVLKMGEPPFDTSETELTADYLRFAIQDMHKGWKDNCEGSGDALTERWMPPWKMATTAS